jgi:hypothetical protein
MLQRRPAQTPGERLAIPTFIVVPRAEQVKVNIARCDAMDEAFI